MEDLFPQQIQGTAGILCQTVGLKTCTSHFRKFERSYGLSVSIGSYYLHVGSCYPLIAISSCYYYFTLSCLDGMV